MCSSYICIFTFLFFSFTVFAKMPVPYKELQFLHSRTGRLWYSIDCNIDANNLVNSHTPYRHIFWISNTGRFLFIIPPETPGMQNTIANNQNSCSSYKPSTDPRTKEYYPSKPTNSSRFHNLHRLLATEKRNLIMNWMMQKITHCPDALNYYVLKYFNKFFQVYVGANLMR